MLSVVAERGIHDDRRTVDLGPRPPNAEEFAEEPRTVLDEARSLDGAGDAASLDTVTGDAVPRAASDHDTSAMAADAIAEAVPADPIHVLPTQQISAPPRRASTSLSKVSASATATSPVDAMKLDEIARTRVFLKFAFALTAGGIILVLSTGGDEVAKIVVLIGSVAAALGAV